MSHCACQSTFISADVVTLEPPCEVKVGGAGMTFAMRMKSGITAFNWALRGGSILTATALPRLSEESEGGSPLYHANVTKVPQDSLYKNISSFSNRSTRRKRCRLTSETL